MVRTLCPQGESNPRLPACKASTLSTRPGSPLSRSSFKLVSIYSPGGYFVQSSGNGLSNFGRWSLKDYACIIIQNPSTGSGEEAILMFFYF